MINEAHDEATIYLRYGLRRLTRQRADTMVHRDQRIDFRAEDVRPLGTDMILRIGDSQAWEKRIGTFRVRRSWATPELVIDFAWHATKN
jgi:hypothetical protein